VSQCNTGHASFPVQYLNSLEVCAFSSLFFSDVFSVINTHWHWNAERLLFLYTRSWNNWVCVVKKHEGVWAVTSSSGRSPSVLWVQCLLLLCDSVYITLVRGVASLCLPFTQVWSYCCDFLSRTEKNIFGVAQQFWRPLTFIVWAKQQQQKLKNTFFCVSQEELCHKLIKFELINLLSLIKFVLIKIKSFCLKQEQIPAGQKKDLVFLLS